MKITMKKHIFSNHQTTSKSKIWILMIRKMFMAYVNREEPRTPQEIGV